MHVVILERNKLVGRRVARLFAATGASVTTIEEPSALAPVVIDAEVLCADAFDGELVAEHVRARPGLHGVLWTAEPLKRSLKFLVEAGIDHVLGRKDFESPPRSWEIVMLARRLAGPQHPPFAAFLDWGATAIELDVRGTADRDVVVERVQDLVTTLAVPKRVAEMFGELAHELIMNAVYDAKQISDRKSDVELAEAELVHVRCGTDGTRLVLQVRDPFGRLERRHVVDGLARGLASGELDRSQGGAGLGFMVCHNASSALIFDVARGCFTEVTALFELDMNLREFRTQARSLHFWSH